MKILKWFLILVALLALVFFGKGLLTSSVEYECEVSVDKPVEEVWAVMSDTSRSGEWIEGYLRTEPISGDHGTVGAVSNIFVDNNGQELSMEETIKELIPNEKIAMTFTMDFMDMDYAMSVSEEGEGSKITSYSKATGNGIFAKYMVAFMPSAMKKQENKNLGLLRDAIENNTKDYGLGEENETADTAAVE